MSDQPDPSTSAETAGPSWTPPPDLPPAQQQDPYWSPPPARPDASWPPPPAQPGWGSTPAWGTTPGWGAAPGSPPPGMPAPRPRRHGLAIGLTVVSVLGVALLVAVGALVGHRLNQPTTLSTTPIQQKTVAQAGGGTAITDTKDGMALTLPTGWVQAPHSPSEFGAWARRLANNNPQLKAAISSPQVMKLLNNVTTFCVYTKNPRGQISYFMAMKSPGAMGRITQQAIAAMEQGMSTNPNLHDVHGELATVAGAPAVRVTASMDAHAMMPASRLGTVYVQFYAVPSDRSDGFFVYFYDTVPGDPRGDVKSIMASFDPNYTG